MPRLRPNRARTVFPLVSGEHTDAWADRPTFLADCEIPGPTNSRLFIESLSDERPDEETHSVEQTHAAVAALRVGDVRAKHSGARRSVSLIQRERLATALVSYTGILQCIYLQLNKWL